MGTQFQQENVQGSLNGPPAQDSHFSRTNELLLHITNYTLTPNPITYPSVHVLHMHICDYHCVFLLSEQLFKTFRFIFMA